MTKRAQKPESGKHVHSLGGLDHYNVSKADPG